MCGKNAEQSISISAPGGQKDVKPVAVGWSDDEAGVVIVSPPDNLRPASGSISAKADNHAIVAGTILLEQADTQAALGNRGIAARGSFRLNLRFRGRFPGGGICSAVISAGDPEGTTGPDPRKRSGAVSGA
jgi:hypothetical protein